MNDDRNRDCHTPLCPPAGPSRPINLAADPPPENTGFVIVRLKSGSVTRRDDLAAAAKEAGAHTLSAALKTFGLSGRPLITSIKPEELEQLERRAMASDAPPLHSLSTYFRLDARHAVDKVEEILAALHRVPEIELAYREKTASDPVNAANDTYAGSQNYLDAAPTGIDARWVWLQPNGDGTGMHFVDLEQG